MEGAVCAKTIYTPIEKGEIPGVSNETLWKKRARGKKHKSLHRRAKRGTSVGRSIDERPEEVADRPRARHWEIDLMVGGKGAGSAALFTLIERKSRKLIIHKIKDKTAGCGDSGHQWHRTFDGQGAFKVAFKSITADNGS